MTASCGSLATFRPDATALSKSDVVQMQTGQLWAVKLQMMGVCPACMQELPVWLCSHEPELTKADCSLGVKAALGPYRSGLRMLRGGEGASRSLRNIWVAKSLRPDTLQDNRPIQEKEGLFYCLHKQRPWNQANSPRLPGILLMAKQVPYQPQTYFFFLCMQNPATISWKYEKPS